MNQSKWQWGAFLFDGSDVSFPESNPLFVKRAKDVDNNKPEEVGDWWEFFDGSKDGIHFLLLKCDGGLKADLGNRLLKKEVPAEEDTFLDFQLYHWTQAFGDKGVIFLHWHNDWDSSLEKTAALQAFMAPRFPSVIFRCVGSQMPMTKYGCVFDTRNPVVPVTGFNRWFDMFEAYWSCGAKGVNEHTPPYTNETFPCHWTLAASTKDASTTMEGDKVPVPSAGRDLPSGSSPKRKEEDKQPPERQLSENGGWFPKVQRFLLCFTKYMVGLVVGLLALGPLLAVKRYLPVEAFHELTSKAKVVMLLLAFLFAVFATCVWGVLFRVLMSNSAKKDRE